MAYIPITSNEIATGEPVTNSTQTKIKNNFDNHESRLVGVETGTSTIYPPLIFRVNGLYGSIGSIDGLLKTTPNFNLQISGIRILIDKAGVSGTTEIDIKYKSGGGAWTSVLSSTPTAPYTGGDDYISNNAVIDLDHNQISAGDIIRLDLLSSQVDADSFLVRIDYSKT